MENVLTKKKIIPLNENVLVKLVVHKETAGGIVLPSGNEDIRTGHIAAVGGGVPDDFVRTKLKRIGPQADGVQIGSKVFLPKGDKLGDKFEDGDDVFLLLSYKYIGAIIEEK